MRTDPSLILHGNIPLLVQLLDPDVVATFLQNVDFLGYQTRAAKTTIVIRALGNLPYVEWKRFLKFLRMGSCPAQRELGRLLSYVVNRPKLY